MAWGFYSYDNTIDLKEAPEVIGKKWVEKVRFYDSLLKRDIEVPADAVILSTGMIPKEPETTSLQGMFKIPRSLDGFFMELHPELGPVETTTDGVFISGTIQGPKDISDSISQGTAAAIKASRLLVRDKVSLEAAVAEIDEVLCRSCGTCEDLCPFNAPKTRVNELGRTVYEINPALCKGCGACVSSCICGAINIKGFSDAQILATIDAS